ncbi:unnamed protein product, partial [Nesidiocoris tenuis]
MEIKRWYIAKHQWPLFRRVVVDFSHALMKGVLHAWGSTDLCDYLDATYRVVVQGNIVVPCSTETPIVLKLCCAHLLKNITKDIDQAGSVAHFGPFLKE